MGLLAAFFSAHGSAVCMDGSGFSMLNQLTNRIDFFTILHLNLYFFMNKVCLLVQFLCVPLRVEINFQEMKETKAPITAIKTDEFE